MPILSPAVRVAVLSALRETGAGVAVRIVVSSESDVVTITRTVPTRSAAEQEDAREAYRGLSVEDVS
jgi:hypothetical protein